MPPYFLVQLENGYAWVLFGNALQKVNAWENKEENASQIDIDEAIKICFLFYNFLDAERKSKTNPE